MLKRFALNRTCFALAILVVVTVAGCGSGSDNTVTAVDQSRGESPRSVDRAAVIGDGFRFPDGPGGAASNGQFLVVQNASRNQGSYFVASTDGSITERSDGVATVAIGPSGDWFQLAAPPPLGARVQFSIGKRIYLVGWSCVTEDCVQQLRGFTLSDDLQRWREIDLPYDRKLADPSIGLVKADGEEAVVAVEDGLVHFDSSGRVAMLPLPSETDSAADIAPFICGTKDSLVRVSASFASSTERQNGAWSGSGAPELESAGLQTLQLRGNSEWVPRENGQLASSFLRACTRNFLVVLDGNTEHKFNPDTGKWTERTIELPEALKVPFTQFAGPPVLFDDAHYFVEQSSGQVVKRSGRGEWSSTGIVARNLIVLEDRLVGLDTRTTSVVEVAP